MQVLPILPAQPTLDQEGKQEEEDPTDHQRQFAAAYAEEQRQTALEAGPQNADERAQAQHDDQSRRAEVRSEQTDQERDALREQNRVRHKVPKRCYGHVNHEDFRASGVYGYGQGRCGRTASATFHYDVPFMPSLENSLLNLTSSAASRAGCNFPLSSLHPQDCYSGMVTRNFAAISEHTTRHLPSPPSELRQAITLSETSIKTKVWRDNMAFTRIAFRGQWDTTWDRFYPTSTVAQGRECHPSSRKSTLGTPTCKSARSAGKLRNDLARGIQVKDIRYVLHSKPSEPRTYNVPTVSEVGVAMVDDGNLTRPRDLYVSAKDHSLLRLFETDEKYDPLQYPLLFPYGDLGWKYTDVYANGASTGTSELCLCASTWRIAFSRRLTIRPRYIKTGVFSSSESSTNERNVNRNSYDGLPRTKRNFAQSGTMALRMPFSTRR
ncbi:unnamed protein product [Phytophthora fragariaefolia]|uniref:Unnamed protein product n=1 Tax=Phytophthora fragariaefolia TaxID=1490495 RepID=A0A9W6U2N8_9STRA|nr:unnamed protein product [Phytophthora fragariaefolia]